MPKHDTIKYWNIADLVGVRGGTYTDWEGLVNPNIIVNQLVNVAFKCCDDDNHTNFVWDVVMHMAFESLDQAGTPMEDPELLGAAQAVMYLLHNYELMMSGIDWTQETIKKATAGLKPDENHCRHGVYIGNPYGPDHLCGRCENGED